ncbi:hypothetical protein MRX96_026366 [Rhipicephalus microplus]
MDAMSSDDRQLAGSSRGDNTQKYFDSGDYNMAIAKGLTRVECPKATGGLIPTADSLPPRRASLGKSKLAT